MKLKFGYTPVQDNVRLDITDSLPYVTDVYCDFKNLYCNVNNGHYAHPYTATRRPLDGGGLGEFVGPHGLKQIQEFLKKRLDYPIKATWEFFSISPNGPGSKVLFSLKIIDDQPKIEIKESFVGKNSSGNGETEVIDLEQLEVYYNMNSKGILNTYNIHLLNDLKLACDYFNITFEVFPLEELQNICPLLKPGNNYYQLFVNDEKNLLSYYIWEQEKINSINVFYIDLPMNEDSFLEETKNQTGQYYYESVVNELLKHLEREELLLLEPEQRPIAVSVGEIEVMDHQKTIEQVPIRIKVEDGAIFHHPEIKEFNQHTFSLDSIPIDNDIHLYKQIGKVCSFGETKKLNYQNLTNNYVCISTLNSQFENIYIFSDAVFLVHNDKGEEIAQLPNQFISKKFNIQNVYLAKTKILLDCVMLNNKKEKLFLIDLVTLTIDGRK